MPKFLSTRGTSLQIEEIISKASNFIVIISPFIRLPQSLLQLLQEATERGVRVIVVNGKKQLDVKVKKQLEQISQLELYFVETLHAKCYFNEQNLVISSMNLYDFSEVNNWEMSILIDKDNDSELYLASTGEAKRILKSTGMKVPDILNSTKDSTDLKIKEPTAKSIIHTADLQPKVQQKINNSPQQGFCIRCGEKIPSDLERPFCLECYKKWHKSRKKVGNEIYCHLCGNSAPTTIEYPVCSNCYYEITANIDK